MDADTVRRMQAVTAATWRIEGPHAPQHVGDVAWMRYQHSGREHEWRVKLWQRGGEDVAWAWVREPDSMLFWCLRPDAREALVDEVLEWAQTGIVEVQSTDAVSRAALERQGYALDDDARVLAIHQRPLLDEPMPELPPGFRVRTVRPDDLPARVELHRVVWAPSRVTEESYRNVQAAWPYRPELDCVVEGPGGRLVSYCLAWLDPDNRAGEFEPVGTHPDFRRLGLGAAVCRFALRRLEEEGATRAVVYAIANDPGNTGAKALYESVGFVETSRFLRYARDLS
jgi:ribosomal protein S18 acetylase RimI-like enzyme